MASASRNTNGFDFEEPEDGFADDDLLSPDDVGLMDPSNVMNRSFLERDNFENEIGTVGPDDPFAEDFSDISHLNIVEVIADGDRVGRPIIVIFAYRFPSNKTFDHQKFLRFLQFTLDKVVDLDYTIVYFHYGLRSNNKPPLKWLIQAYQMLDRRYKKNLKRLYLVHPTRFIRIAWRVFQPFISMKFERKMQYVNFLHELDNELRVEQLNLPQPIVDHDATLSFSSNSPVFSPATTTVAQPRPTQQFNVSLNFILNHNPNCEVPPIVTELITFLRLHGMEVEGIFRRSAEVAAIKRLQDRIDMGETINFETEPEFNGSMQQASIHAAVLLKTFLRSLGEPVITNRLYPTLISKLDVPKTEKANAVLEFVRLLPPRNRALLKTVVKFLTEVAANSKANLMNANNLSVVFGPNLTWPTDQQVPVSQLNNLNNFCHKLIVDYDLIFEEA
uniref:Rho GTPase-activating protein 1 n=1 Tax=Steinernema glaseri TaxID=37863 RepID=A0A1I7YEW9_9BILA